MFYLYLSQNNDVAMDAEEMCKAITVGVQLVHFTVSGNNLES